MIYTKENSNVPFMNLRKHWVAILRLKTFLSPPQVPASVKDYVIASVDSASILLAIEGDAVATSAAAFSDLTIRRGTVLFVSANESLSLHISSQSGMTLFRACCLL